MLEEKHVQDMEALLPGQSTENGATRRTALKAALGVGYATVSAALSTACGSYFGSIVVLSV